MRHHIDHEEPLHAEDDLDYHSCQVVGLLPDSQVVDALEPEAENSEDVYHGEVYAEQLLIFFFIKDYRQDYLEVDGHEGAGVNHIPENIDNVSFEVNVHL